MTMQPHLVEFALVSLAISSVLLYPYIGWLKKLQIQQYLREEGPKSHAHKAKTPTAGGVCFIVSAVIGTILWQVYSHCPDDHVLLVTFWALVCGVLGFIDDFAKVRQKANKGISAKSRLLVETVLGFVLGWLLFNDHTTVFVPGHGAPITLPYGADVDGHHLGRFFYACLCAFMTAATTNAVNLHDGMDGLAAGTSSMVFATLALLLLSTGQLPLAAVAAITAGSVLGFLMWNRNPAAIFMGDTGSLFIGGMMAALVMSGGIILWFVPLSLIYIAEALSVMIQVTTFKLTKPYTPEKPMSSLALAVYKMRHKLPGEGKRVFRMAPLHHHYEAVLAEKGVPEWRVVTYFWFAQLGLCLLVLGLFYLWK